MNTDKQYEAQAREAFAAFFPLASDALAQADYCDGDAHAIGGAPLARALAIIASTYGEGLATPSDEVADAFLAFCARLDATRGRTGHRERSRRIADALASSPSREERSTRAPSASARLRTNTAARRAELKADAERFGPIAFPIAIDGAGSVTEWGGATAEQWASMPDGLWSSAVLYAMRAARRGALAGSLRFAPAPSEQPARGEEYGAPSPYFAPNPIEDEEAAQDAVAEVWAMARAGKLDGRPIAGLLRMIAFRLGQRRAQHRIRQRFAGALLARSTDYTLPEDDAAHDPAALASLVSERWRAHAERSPFFAPDRKREQARERARRARERVLPDAEIATLRERNARPDASEEPYGSDRLARLAR